MAARRSEFRLIRDVFAPLAADVPQALSLSDDAAIIEPGPGAMVVSVDALVAGVHFFDSDPPWDIAAKALRVNLSDMAAMGAAPWGCLLALALSQRQDDAWVDGFARGLKADLDIYNVRLLGGDTVSTPGPLTLSITILGTVENPEAALKRSGARVGDDVWVTGTIGDAAFGLRCLQGSVVPNEQDKAYLIDRYRRPQPRVDLGLALRGVASAAMDVSDGLCADAAHIAEASAVGIDLLAPQIPLSDPVRRLVNGASDGSRFQIVLGGGDDYELVFCAPATLHDRIVGLGRMAGTPVTRIGRVTSDRGIRVVSAQGNALAVGKSGWIHEA